jgi:transcriptional regulator with XRE-family HTH domain
MALSNIEIGQRLKFARHRLALSQQDIAEVLGISFQQVQKYEKGLNRINLDNVLLLYHELGINLLGDIPVEGGAVLPDKIADQAEWDLLNSFRNIKNTQIQEKLLHLVKAITNHKE